MSVPLRYHVAIALVGLNIISTAALVTFAYRASRDSLEAQATRAVGVAAREREQALVRLLEQRQDRMRGFLGSVESLCGERAPSGFFGWERECVRAALSGFQTTEHAEATALSYRARRLAARGPRADALTSIAEGQLAVMSRDGDRRSYAMEAARGPLVVRVRFPFDDVDAIFRDRSGLDANGDVFLTDHRGVLLTPARSPLVTQPPLSDVLQPCLAGTTAQRRMNDGQGAETIAGFRAVAAVGGACIVARLPYAAAVVPIHQLGRQFVIGSIGFMVLGAIVSLIVARTATRPIRRLAETAHALEAGHFDRAIPISGPTEIRQLGRALSSMTRSLADLIHREQDARLEAEAANRTKDEFLAMVSHELRTPLTAILGWSSLVKYRRGDESLIAQALDTIERSATGQAHLIDELLDVSRIAGGKLLLNAAADVPLEAVLDAALEAVQPSAAAKHLTIVRRIDVDPGVVAGDADRLQQVMNNVLSNAVRFTPPGGRVEVAVAGDRTMTEIRVSDTGIGIAPEFLPHVFERFRQADASMTRTHGGLGLGLAIARHLVELHGGTIRAESAGTGHGSTFTIRLPRHAPVPAAIGAIEAPAPARSVPPLLGGTCILVVDDDPDTRDVVRAILEGAGATVLTTATAAETRACLQAAHPDVLIADIGMPKEDGYSLLRSVRALAADDVSHVPAIALTAHARPEDVEEARASGFQMHLSKPVDSSTLLSAVTTTLLSSLPN